MYKVNFRRVRKNNAGPAFRPMAEPQCHPTKAATAGRIRHFTHNPRLVQAKIRYDALLNVLFVQGAAIGFAEAMKRRFAAIGFSQAMKRKFKAKLNAAGTKTGRLRSNGRAWLEGDLP